MGQNESSHFEMMAKSLILAWLARLWQGHDWSNIATLHLTRIGGFRFIMNCNSDYEEIKVNKFYKKIFEYALEAFDKDQ